MLHLQYLSLFKFTCANIDNSRPTVLHTIVRAYINNFPIEYNQFWFHCNEIFYTIGK